MVYPPRFINHTVPALISIVLFHTISLLPIPPVGYTYPHQSGLFALAVGSFLHLPSSFLFCNCSTGTPTLPQSLTRPPSSPLPLLPPLHPLVLTRPWVLMVDSLLGILMEMPFLVLLHSPPPPFLSCSLTSV